MTTLDLPSVQMPNFSIDAGMSDERIVVRFTGTADLHAREALETTLKGLHREALAHKAPTAVIDFFALEFMNSSCFKSFVSWISEVQDQPAEAQYRIHFRSNPEMLWQRRSLHALRCFAPDLITIEP